MEYVIEARDQDDMQNWLHSIRLSRARSMLTVESLPDHHHQHNQRTSANDVLDNRAATSMTQPVMANASSSSSSGHHFDSANNVNQTQTASVVVALGDSDSLHRLEQHGHENGGNSLDANNICARKSIEICMNWLVSQQIRVRTCTER